MRHDALLTSAVTEHGGLVLKHKGEGDSTFSVFDDTSAAAAAATEAQRRLSDESWPEMTRIVVRMGIHTGEAVQRGDYYGQTVNRAARVRALAVGGQVLLTSASAALVEGRLPEGTDLVFLRSEVLRGTEKLEAIYELVDHRRAPPPTVPPVPPVAPPSLPGPLTVALPPVFVGRKDLTERIHAAPGSRALIRGSRDRASRRRAWRRQDERGGGGCTSGARSGLDCALRLVRRAREHAVRTVPRRGRPVRRRGANVGADRARREPRRGDLPPRAEPRRPRGALPLTDAVDPETSRRLLFEAITDLMCRAFARPTRPVRPRRLPMGRSQHDAPHAPTREPPRHGLARVARHLPVYRNRCAGCARPPRSATSPAVGH